MVLFDIYEQDNEVTINGYIGGKKNDAFKMVMDKTSYEILECDRDDVGWYTSKIRYHIKKKLVANETLPKQDAMAWY